MWTVEARPWDDPAGSELRARQRAELDARYGSTDHEPGPAPSAADIDLFLVARDVEGRAVACGALRRLDCAAPDHVPVPGTGRALPVARGAGGSAEIKRMFVVPDRRGSGVATAVLDALESAARERGWTTLRLETGTAQPDAQRFYRRAGYREIPLFGSYVGSALSVCFERRLDES